MNSFAQFEPDCQRLGQAGFNDFAAGGLDIVGYAMKLYQLLFGIVNGKAGARILIARLPHRADIDQRFAFWVDADFLVHGVRHRHRVEESQRNVGMPVKEHGFIQALEGQFGIEYGRDIIENFGAVRAAMGQRKILEMADEGQIGQPVSFVVGEVRLSPVRHLFGEDIEKFGVQLAACGVIVISGQGHDASFAHGGYTAARFGPVADNVPCAQVHIDFFLFQNSEDRLKSIVVAVNVAEYSVTQFFELRAGVEPNVTVEYEKRRVRSKAFCISLYFM